MAQDGPKMAQDVPKMDQDGSRWPQEGPRWPQDDPRWPQEGPRWPKMAPSWPKMAPRWAQDGPREAQDGPKRGPKRVPNRSSEAFQHRSQKRECEGQSEKSILGISLQRGCIFRVNLRGGDPHFPGFTRAPEAPRGGDIGEGVDRFKDWKSTDLTRLGPKAWRI